MTITCPGEFYEAEQFADSADRALEAAIERADDAETRAKLEARRCQGTRTLMACFGYRANSDAQDNKHPYLPEDSEVHYENGTVRTILDCGADKPVRETFIYTDMSPHSFFFREEWIDPVTRQRVEIHDRCWYVFLESSQDRVDRLTDAALENAVGEKVLRTYDGKWARESAARGLACRDAMRRRVGMCGGIIYHADYVDGKQAGFGSWSTHT